MDSDAAVRGLVSGRVQGVGFRYFVLRQARAAGLRGFVRNLDDGRVEFLLQGPSAAIEAVLAEIRSGPAQARVSEVVADVDRDAPAARDFVIR